MVDTVNERAPVEQQHDIDTPVGRLHVRLIGDGHPALLWHSLFVDDRSWDRLIPLLTGSRQLISVTGPGHGSSTDPGRPYSNENCAAAARLVLRHLDIRQPVDWIGNAWGGHVGIIAATTWPDLIRTLTVIGTPVAPLTPLERARTYLLLGLHRIAGPSRMVLQGTTDVLLSEQTRANDPEAVQLVHDCLRRADRRLMRNAVISVSLRRTDLLERVRRVTQPTLIITGDRHHGYTPDQAQATARLLPRGDAAAVPDAAYLVPLEAPQAVAALISAFWTADDTAPAT
ncbi:MAG: alpha/beta hydrolase [Lapillicoccus sp.]